MKVLEITSYEPPASGWVSRVKLLRRVIHANGGECEILDIGPNRKLTRSGCVTVMGASDFVAKVFRFARAGYTIHCHINGEYFRGMLLALTAVSIGRSMGRRCVTTFHAGENQIFLVGWKKIATWPFYWLIFSLSNAIVCNKDAVKKLLARYQTGEKIFAIQAFSMQYLEFEECELGSELETFIREHDDVLSTYVCFRDGFFFDVFVEAMAKLISTFPNVGIVIIGTGDEPLTYCDPKIFKEIESNLILVGDLDHDRFMTMLKRSTVHIRTPITDGVSATVLEAMSLRVPVVASDNGTRPEGVITYDAENSQQMAEKIEWTIRHRETVKDAMPQLAVSDTTKAELDVLRGVSVEDL